MNLLFVNPDGDKSRVINLDQVSYIEGRKGFASMDDGVATSFKLFNGAYVDVFVDIKIIMEKIKALGNTSIIVINEEELK